MTVNEQAEVFLVMLLLGAALGGLWDAASSLCRALRLGRFALGLTDTACGVACAAGIIAAAAAMRVQAARGYVFAGVLAGMALYAVTAGALIRAAHRAVVRLWGGAGAKKEKFGAESEIMEHTGRKM